MKNNCYETEFSTNQKDEHSAYRSKEKSSKKKNPILLILVVILVVGVWIALSSEENSEKIVWEDMALGHMLPAPSGDKGKIWNNSAEGLHVDIDKITDDQYESYVKACNDKGFTIDGIKDDYSYKAYNSDGYKLYVSYSGNDTQMSVELDIPMELTEIKWPSGVAGKQLPEPKSKQGKFLYEYHGSFLVYIGNTSKEAYKEYVAVCADKGFDVNYDKRENYYNAENAEGWILYLKYEGFNIMSIDIDAPDDYDESDTTTEPTAKETTTESTTTEKTDNLVDGMRPEFKEAMDSYETFMTDYVDFMKKIEEDPDDLSILADYADYMKKYADFSEDFEAWDDEDMNNSELAYYIDVQARVSKKLLEVSE